jgi:hypothetical protein
MAVITFWKVSAFGVQVFAEHVVKDNSLISKNLDELFFQNDYLGCESDTETDNLKIFKRKGNKFEYDQDFSLPKD